MKLLRDMYQSARAKRAQLGQSRNPRPGRTCLLRLPQHLTAWPWYSNIAPVSWLVLHDVEEGREVLNFSEWGTNGEGEEGEEMAESIWEGEMPMPIFLLTHPEARLTDAELDQLAQGLMATGGGEGEGASPTNGATPIRKMMTNTKKMRTMIEVDRVVSARHG